MFKLSSAAAVLCLVLATLPAHARSDQSFVRTATQANLAEIDVGRLASRKARSEDVRAYGSMLLRQHRDANQKLGRLARRADLDVPTRANAEQRAAYRRLSLLSGRRFDRAFLEQMIKDHRGAVALFRAQSRERRALTARFARETLPALEQHLARAQSLLDETTGGRYDARDEDRGRDMDRNENEQDNDRSGRRHDRDHDEEQGDDSSH